jgi:hypothetical protein
MGRRRRRSLLTRNHPAPWLSTPSADSEADGDDAEAAAGEVSSTEEEASSASEADPSLPPVAEEPAVDPSPSADEVAAGEVPVADAADSEAASDPSHVDTPLRPRERPAEIDTVDLGGDPILPEVEAAQAAAEEAPAGDTPAPPVRFVAQREMLLGWRPRRPRRGGRPFVTVAELRLASSIAALATVMLIVGFLGLALVYVAWP